MTSGRKPGAPRTASAKGRQVTGARRWPDLMIGGLALLLLGGFGTLLFRKNPEPAPITNNATTSPAIPSAPGTQAQVPTATQTPVVTPPANTGTGSPTTDGGGTSSAQPAATGTGGEQPATPAQEPTTAVAPPVTPPPVTPAPAVEPTPETPAKPAPTEPQPEAPASTPGVPPRAGGAVATSEQRVPLRSDYRISLGSFATAGTVRTQTAAVAGIGYTVYPINVGRGYVAQVGPFASEEDAREALADIQRAYPNAVLFRPRNPAASRPAETPAASAPETATTTEPPAPAAEPAPPADGPTYLQVGAFDRVESAQALVQQLRDLGYDPNVNAPEGRKVTVSVGPYTGDALTRTEARLTENGLDHFRVR